MIGVLYRGTDAIEHVDARPIMLDGLDATDHLCQMVTALDSRCNVIMTDGITVGGFNMLDIQTIHQRTQIPVIAVTRTDPDFDAIEDAIADLPNTDERSRIIEHAGKVYRGTIHAAPVFFQTAGIEQADAESMLQQAADEATIPEPIRAADLIGDGLQEVIA